MCTDKRRISDIRNLNHKSGRRVPFVSVCLIMALCFCVPAFATGGEILEYEDTFDDNNSLAIVTVKRSVNLYVSEDTQTIIPFDDYHSSNVTENSISLFTPAEFESIRSQALENGCNRVTISCSVSFVYRRLNSGVSFPISNVSTFSLTQCHCFVSLNPTSNPDSFTFNTTFRYSLPTFTDNSNVSDSEPNDVAGNRVVSRYYPVEGVKDKYYNESVKIMFLGVDCTYNSENFDSMQIPTLSFSFSNIYQYVLAPETTVAPDTTFAPGVDTVNPVDTMQGNPDELDNVLDERNQDFVDNYAYILNGFSWIKYASCFGLIGQFLGSFFQFEPFSDILNSWAIFAVFNIVLGGFITGVSAFIRMQVRQDEKRQREVQNEIRREKMSRFWSNFYRTFGKGRGRHDD